jgi:hypothetical protein
MSTLLAFVKLRQSELGISNKSTAKQAEKRKGLKQFGGQLKNTETSSA